MPNKPTPRRLSPSATSADILNAIRESATAQYKTTVPKAIYGNAGNLHDLAAAIFDYTPNRNEFLTALYNRIAVVIITNKLYSNPLARFKRGLIETGETVEEIFVDLVNAHEYNIEKAQDTFMQVERPNVHAAFHTLNYKKFYKTTVSRNELKTAFTSWQGVDDLLSKITTALYTSANYDEYQTFKYMIARCLLNGYLLPVGTAQLDADHAKNVVQTMRATSNNMEFMSRDRNLAGVANFTDKSNQIMLIDTNAEALIDVNVLAAAFNMSETEFLSAQRVAIDGFGNLDDARLTVLFADDPYNTYIPLTEDEKTLLNNIPAAIISTDWFMTFDNLLEFTESPYNSEGLYYNMVLHKWSTFSVSPFAEAVAFVSTSSTVTGVDVTPSTATMPKGSMLQLTASVTKTGLASNLVQWSISTASDTVIDSSGVLTIGRNETAGTITVTATSVFNPQVSGTATITIS